MTDIILPNKNVTGDNLWSQVEGNDQAIIDVVNGDITNGNISASAELNASKLLDGSIATAKIADSAITTAKIAALAVKSGDTDLASHVGSVTNYGTTGAAQPVCQVTSVAPGVYLAIGSAWRMGELSFVASSGAASGSGVTTAGPPVVADDYYRFHMGVLIVTATATIDLRASAVGTTTNSASLLLFGIKSGA